MVLLNLFLNLLSLMLISFIGGYAWRNRDKNSCLQLFEICCLLFYWGICACVQSLSAFTGPEKMVWFRVMQIGPLYTIPAFLSYVLHYTGNYRLAAKRFLWITYAVHTFAVFLVFTDPWLHGYWKPTMHWTIDRFGTLVMTNTSLGNAITIFGLLVYSFSVWLLFRYYIRSSDGTRGQARCILLASVVLGSYSIARNLLVAAQNEVPPIAFVFSVPALIVLVGILRYDFISLIPIAYQEVFEVIDEGVIIFSNDGRVLSFNLSAQRIFTLTGHGVLKPDRRGLQKVQEIFDTRYPKWKGTKDGYNQFSARLPRGKNVYYYHFSVYPFDNQGKRAGSIIMIRDVTKEHKQTEILKCKAERDGLTGIYNRQTFTRLVEQKLAESTGLCSMIYLDLDYFKMINDTYGHAFGDQVLQETCGCIIREIEGNAIFGRVGGEEFVVFFPECSCKQAAQTAEAIRAAVEHHVFEYMGETVHITTSIGVAAASDLSFDEFYQHADQMLYCAKNDGRNCVRVWSEDMQ